MEDRAPPSFPMRVDQFADRRIEARLAQRFDDEGAFPPAIPRKIPVLRLAAAAHGKMRTYRRDALGARAFDADEMAAVRMPRKRLDLHDLAGKRVRHEHRAIGRIGNAVAAMADARDGQPLSHAALRAGIR